MSEHSVFDDRFDRRELLLHLGDILEAVNCLTTVNRPDTPVAQLAQDEHSLRDFAFLRALAPTMTSAEFSARVAHAFCVWPKKLLEVELDRTALASTVQRALFDGNPGGWEAYVAHVRKKVAWFGTGLSGREANALAGLGHDAAKHATPVAPTLPAKSAASFEKKGWPWPDPMS